MTETPPGGYAPQADFESQYRRILEASGCRTQVELADFLEVRQSSISDARRRKTVPSGWLAMLLVKKHVNPDWIRSGLGGMIAMDRVESAAASAP
ncbi:MAG: helix-turn-helix domain containing protein [Deltaproteobacteria bacterium]|nr:helix-turn-helix domain containing protein [Deltaproteobacteria bacterium]